jgi:hypothetical protein
MLTFDVPTGWSAVALVVLVAVPFVADARAALGRYG